MSDEILVVRLDRTSIIFHQSLPLPVCRCCCDVAKDRSRPLRRRVLVHPDSKTASPAQSPRRRRSDRGARSQAQRQVRDHGCELPFKIPQHSSAATVIAIRRAPACRTPRSRERSSSARPASCMCRVMSRRWRAMRACSSMPATGSRRRARSICFRTPRTSRRLSLSPVSGLHEAFEQLAEFSGPPEILRMPLHGDAKRRAGFLHRLDDAVRRRCGHVETLRRVLHRLVMPAVDVARLAVPCDRRAACMSCDPFATHTSCARAGAGLRHRMFEARRSPDWECPGTACRPSPTFTPHAAADRQQRKSL